MAMRFVPKRYRHDLPFSYALGASPCIELLRQHPQWVLAAYLRPSYRPNPGAPDLFQLCAEWGLSPVVDDRPFNRVGAKGNHFLMCAFRKTPTPLCGGANHICLHHPGDMGNLGTILRTGLGFGYRDFALIRPCADPYDPRAIRASMGAFFHVRVQCFEHIGSYLAQFPGHARYPFMLDGEIRLEQLCPAEPHALVFGNEAAGLDPSFHALGPAVRIPHGGEIDSLNLSVAVALAAQACYARRGTA